MPNHWANARRYDALRSLKTECYPPILITPLVILIFKKVGIRGHHELAQHISALLHDPVLCVCALMTRIIISDFDMFESCSSACCENARWMQIFVDVIEDRTNKEIAAIMDEGQEESAEVRMLASDDDNYIEVEYASIWSVRFNCVALGETKSPVRLENDWSAFDIFDLCHKPPY